MKKFMGIEFEHLSNDDIVAAYLKLHGFYLVGVDVYTIHSDEFFGIIEEIKTENRCLNIKIRQAMAINCITVEIKI